MSNTLKTLFVLSMLLSAPLWAGSVRAADAPAAPRYQQRWFYSMYNLQVEKNADTLIALIERAGKAGYNGVVLADYKLNILDRVPAHYFKNAAKVKAAAAKAGLEIIPCVFPIGYSNGVLAHDVNLAEGLPVVDAPFVAKGGQAVPAEPSAKIANGDMEQAKGDKFAGYSFQDEIGKISFADTAVFHGGKMSLRFQDAGGKNARINQRVKVRPNACYRLSCWVKTENCTPTGGFNVLALGHGDKGRVLTFLDGHVKPTADWTRYEVVFNSLEFAEVNVYVGQWGNKSGKLWIDDFAIEELSLVNLLRRPGCPFKIISDDGKTVYEEGKDFQPVADAQCGKTPYEGNYGFSHTGAAIKLTADSRIKEGDKLKVSWYHPILTHGFQVMACPSEPKLYDLLRDQAKRVNEHFAPKTWFMGHDEIRCLNHCKACKDRGLTGGAILADNVKRCVEILKEISPQSKIVVWSDMFDPHHNAVDKYYLVDGSMAESWKGLPTDVVIANWNGGKAAASLKFFADRGHPQILAGYYDVNDLSGFHRWDKPAQGIKGVTGFLYTTWDAKYNLLEDYGKAMLHGPDAK